MKSKYWILLLAAVALICGGLSLWLLFPGESATMVQVYSEGELLHTLPLSVDREVTVISPRGTNIVTVKDGKVAVTEADCPDGYCVDRGFCDRGAQIVCLPNRLVLKFVGQQQVDTVVG